MAKMKTNSAAKKRFKKLASGKFKASFSMRRHLLTKKSKKRKRQLRMGAYMTPKNCERLSGLMPN